MFHILQDLTDNSKTYALVDKILQQRKDLKGLKRGDKVIEINGHRLQNKTPEELQHIIHQLHLQEQITLTFERRKWRQNGIYVATERVFSVQNLDSSIWRSHKI